MNLSELLPVHPMFKDQYFDMIENGKKILRQSKITILFLARNVEKQIGHNLDTIINFFHTYTYQSNFNIVGFENDSTDKTLEILNKYQIKFPKQIRIISENNGRQKFGPVKSQVRVQALSEYRNKLKDYGKNLPSDFVVILDIDFNQISLAGLLNSFGWLSLYPSVQGIAGNSFEYKKGLVSSNPDKYSLWNYDSWAFRQNCWLDLHYFHPCSINETDPMLWFGLWIPATGSIPMKVNSAFGGCCIYRSNIYFDGIYSFEDCEHVCFHHSLNKKHGAFHLTLNPSQQMLF